MIKVLGLDACARPPRPEPPNVISILSRAGRVKAGGPGAGAETVFIGKAAGQRIVVLTGKQEQQAQPTPEVS